MAEPPRPRRFPDLPAELEQYLFDVENVKFRVMISRLRLWLPFMFTLAGVLLYAIILANVSAARQNLQAPHALTHDTRMRSPTLSLLTAPPTSAIVPTASCPRMRLSTIAGTSPLRMCRSVPQIVVVSTCTMASVSAASTGRGTSSHVFLPGPW